MFSGKTSKQKAVAIIYVLLALPVLLTLAALVVNLAITYNALEQARGNTRLLSLSALKLHYETIDGIYMSGSSPTPARYMATLSKIIPRLDNLTKENKFIGHRDKVFKDLKFSWDYSAGSGLLPDDSFPDGVKLTAGTYYQREPVGETFAAGDKCNPAISPDYPCFNPMYSSAYAAANFKKINAYRVDGRYLDNLTMRLFASFLGDPVKEIKTCAIATSIKKNIVYLVDLSASSVAETHIRRNVYQQINDPASGRGGYYAYEINPPATEPATPSPLPAPLIPDFNDGNGYCDKQDSLLGSTQYCDFKFLRDYNPLSPTTPGNKYDGPPMIGSATATHHYFDNFESVTITGPNLDYTSYHPPASANPIQGKTYLIDEQTDPQPLKSIFRALRIGVTELDSRNIPGDKTGIIFFEKSLIWFRIFKLTHELGYIRTITAWHLTGLSPIRWLYGLFPTSEDNTDILISLKEAVRQLKENRASGLPTSDSVIYIGDFLPNCIGPDSSRTCSDDYTTYNTAVREIWDFVKTEMIPSGISLNIIHLGKHVGAHTMNIPGGSGYLTDNQARKLGKDFVKGGYENFTMPTTITEWSGVYSNMTNYSMTNYVPFYQAGYDAYTLVRATGGFFKAVYDTSPTCTNGPMTTHGQRKKCSTDSIDKQLEDYIKEMVNTDNPFRVVNTDCDL